MFFIKSLKKTFKLEDFAMIRMYTGEYVKSPVDWVAGKPYSYSILKGNKCLLLPMGVLQGKIYEISWEPASDKTFDYFHGLGIFNRG